MNIYYVYFYLRENYTPYYVGKGKGRRAFNAHKNMPIPKNKSRIIIIEQNLSELQAFILERYYIRWFGRKDNNTGILRNLTNGGEGASGKSYTAEERKLMADRARGPNPKKARIGELNGMFGKTHTAKVKKAQADRAVSLFKGKTYEEMYGFDKANDLKKLRSDMSKGKDNSGSNNPRFDNRIFTFYNIESNDSFTGTRYDFYTKFNLNKGSVSNLINHGITYKNWIIP